MREMRGAVYVSLASLSVLSGCGWAAIIGATAAAGGGGGGGGGGTNTTTTVTEPIPAVTPEAITATQTTDTNGNGIVNPGDRVLITFDAARAGNDASVLSGVMIFADLRDFGVVGEQALVDDGSNGDLTAGDQVYSLQLTTARARVDLTNATVRVRAQSRLGQSSLTVASASSLNVDLDVPTFGSNTLATAIVVDSLQQGTINDGDTVTFVWSSLAANTPDPVTVTADLSQFGLGVQVPLRDDGVGADLFAGDGLFSISFTINDQNVSFAPSGISTKQRFLPDWFLVVTDDAGNTSGRVPSLNQQEFDNQRPALLSAITRDRDGDGAVDSADLTFDEPVRDGTFDPTAFRIGGVSCTGMDTGAAANDQQIMISLTSPIMGTGPQEVTFVAGVVEDLAGQNLPTIADGDLAETDGAPPIIVSAIAADNQVRIFGADAGDTVTLQFSEPIGQAGQAVQIDATNIDQALALNNGHSWLDGQGRIDSAVFDSTRKFLTVTLTGEVARPSIADLDLITAGGAVVDTAGLAVLAPATIGGSFFANPDTTTIVVDSVAASAGATVPVSVDLSAALGDRPSTILLCLKFDEGLSISEDPLIQLGPAVTTPGFIIEVNFINSQELVFAITQDPDSANYGESPPPDSIEITNSGVLTILSVDVAVGQPSGEKGIRVEALSIADAAGNRITVLSQDGRVTIQ